MYTTSPEAVHVTDLLPLSYCTFRCKIIIPNFQLINATLCGSKKYPYPLDIPAGRGVSRAKVVKEKMNETDFQRD